MRDPRQLWVPTRMSYFGIAYNTRLVPAGDGAENLRGPARPEMEGQDGLAGRSRHVGAPLFVTNLRLTWGEDKAMAYLRAAADAEHRQFRRRQSAHAGGPGDRRRISDCDPDFRPSSADQRRQGRAGHRAAAAAGRERVRDAGHSQGLAQSARRAAADGLPAVQGGAADSRGGGISAGASRCRSACRRSRRSFRQGRA